MLLVCRAFQNWTCTHFRNSRTFFWRTQDGTLYQKENLEAFLGGFLTCELQKPGIRESARLGLLRLSSLLSQHQEVSRQISIHHDISMFFSLLSHCRHSRCVKITISEKPLQFTSINHHCSPTRQVCSFSWNYGSSITSWSFFLKSECIACWVASKLPKEMCVSGKRRKVLFTAC